MSDIVALGELLIDFAPDGTANPGGAPCNFLAAAKKYGASCEFIGKVGKDQYGEMLCDTLTNAGVGTNGLVWDDKHETTKAFVTLDDNGDRSFSFLRGADIALEEREINYSIVRECKIFHFAGSLSLTDDPCRSTLKKVVKYAKKRNKLVSFDPNLREPLWKGDLERARKELLWGLENADIVKMSDDEYEFLGEPDFMHNKLVMITAGSKGATLLNAKARVDIACPKVKPIDTTGAGDIFAGAAIAKILEIGKDPAELSEEELKTIGEFACMKASLSTEKMGAIPSIPD
ncbi:MAG: carbohydrate kinase [Bacillota bacterium]|nr:carbohydrate kinase [Bacillota bacterium]